MTPTTESTDTFLNDVACLIAAMREAGVTGDGTYFEQEFRAVERAMVERGAILPREGFATAESTGGMSSVRREGYAVVNSMTEQTPTTKALWKAKMWDKPVNGVRYYVARGEEYAEDARGNVLIMSKKEAETLATKTNVEVPP